MLLSDFVLCTGLLSETFASIIADISNSELLRLNLYTFEYGKIIRRDNINAVMCIHFWEVLIIFIFINNAIIARIAEAKAIILAATLLAEKAFKNKSIKQIVMMVTILQNKSMFFHNVFNLSANVPLLLIPFKGSTTLETLLSVASLTFVPQYEQNFVSLDNSAPHLVHFISVSPFSKFIQPAAREVFVQPFLLHR